MAKDKDYIKLIHSKRWVKLRKEVLTEHPICQKCEEKGYYNSATEVHHIHPVEEMVFYQQKVQRTFDKTNLIALCHECHVQVHRDIGRSGKVATKRMNESQVKSVNKRFFE